VLPMFPVYSVTHVPGCSLVGAVLNAKCETVPGNNSYGFSYFDYVLRIRTSSPNLRSELDLSPGVELLDDDACGGRQSAMRIRCPP